MTLEYRCSNCGSLLQTTNADPLHDEIERLRKALAEIADPNLALLASTKADIARKALKPKEYNPEFVKEILEADKEPSVTSGWCMTCEDWLFHDDPQCQNIDCQYQQLEETP